MQDGQPCEWNTYVSVADADATMAKVREAGGTVIVEPMDVMGMGKMAIFTDPTGAACGLWEPGTFVGAELVNEDGSFGWNELGTRDVPAAREFYGKVFGWTVEEQEMPGMGTYNVWKDGEHVRGGMVDITGMAPDEAPAELARLLHRPRRRRRGGDDQSGRRSAAERPVRHPGRPARDPDGPAGRDARGDGPDRRDPRNRPVDPTDPIEGGQMSKVTSYAPGTPCWVDLSCADIDASVSFYADLFGWESGEAGLGGDRRLPPRPLRRRRRRRADAEVQSRAPQMWNTHISVADAAATAAKVTAAGGTVIARAGRGAGPRHAAVFKDPDGAAFAIWQPGTFIGAARVNGPGALCWNELGTRDVEGAKAFYGEVFGWEAEELEICSAPTAAPARRSTSTGSSTASDIGGMMDISGMLPAEVPAHWLVYFGVEDTDAAVAKVKAAGGEVRFGPVDIPAGRFAVVTEPNAEPGVFAVIKPAG